MVTVFGFRFPLPPVLAFLGEEASFVLTIAVWVVIALVVYFLLSSVIRHFTRRTETEVDDVILRVSERPFLLSVALFGAFNSLELLGIHEGLIVDLEKALISLLIAVATFWVWRVFKEVIIYYGEEWAERTESSFDDVLLPVVNQLGPLFIFLIGATIILQYLGMKLDALLVAIGGISFIAAFALQDSLSNIFGGISLLVDTPFKYGDLVIIEDTVCVIEKIGLRVTQLYNTDEHSVIFMPNSQIANEQLVNITRPTPARVTSIEVSVARDGDPQKVMGLLEEIADSHPNILGDVQAKIEAIRKKIAWLAPQGRFEEIVFLSKETGRLQLEDEMNDHIEFITGVLDDLADMVEGMEAAGLDAQEKAQIEAGLVRVEEHIAELRRIITAWMMMLRYTWAADSTGWPEDVPEIEARIVAYRDKVRETLAAGEIILLGDIPVGRKERAVTARLIDSIVRRRGFAGFDDGLRDIDLRAEFSGQVKGWNKRVCLLNRRLECVREALHAGMERRLDDLIRALGDWTYRELKETTPEWKYPEIVFAGFGDFTLDFELRFYVDNVMLEHFGRASRVETEIRRDIVERFRDEGIEMPVPQQDLRLLNGGARR